MTRKLSLHARMVAVLVLALTVMTTPIFAADSLTRTVKTKGEAEVPGEPVAAQMDVTISFVDRDPDTARNEVAKRVAAIRRALVAQGLDEEDIRTDNLSMSASTDYRTNEVTGYTTRHSLVVFISDIEKLGSVFDAVIKAGATRVDSITYVIKDRIAREEAAMRLAMQDARRKAAVLAGVSTEALSVVKITDLTEQKRVVGSGWFAISQPFNTTDVLVYAIPIEAEVEVEFTF